MPKKRSELVENMSEEAQKKVEVKAKELLEKEIKVVKKDETVEYDVEISMSNNQMTLVVAHPNRTHRSPITPENAMALSKKLEKGAKFFGEIHATNK